MEIKEYHVSEEKAGVRLDAYCAEPVSYTHLDVYKRQIIIFDVWV